MWTRLWTCFWTKFDVSPRSMVQHVWPGCCPDGSSLPVTLPFVASTSRAAWGVAVSHINYLLLSAPCVFMVTWNAELNLSLPARCSARPVPAQSWNNLHTKSGVCVRSVKVCLRFPQLGRNEQAFTQSDHPPMLCHGQKKTPKTVLKGSTSLEAATRRPFKCFQLKNYSTLIFKKYNYNTVSVNTAKLHALSSAVVYRCHLLNMLPPVYCVHGAEKSKSTPRRQGWVPSGCRH